ncbi:uracil-DNA glycosylase [Portibacter marinus]|uniref:uracil-DNA glycosylase n=1 Tax=Portibacter marinus TaxID=2898660 RepID=UPI001F36FD5B|nr:uracil-DNA glycosylase [Portibacter marinus]
MSKEIEIEESWKTVLKEEFDKPYFENIRNFLKREFRSGKTIFPPGPQIFNAFEQTPFHDVKVVILGQDPYHAHGQAMGLSFSVPIGIRIPASLKRIYKELQRDVDFRIPDHGDLTSWARQGVFLLNAMLTVEAAKPGSHKLIGWQEFTNAVIKKISDHREGVIFMLWGNFAKNKKSLIDLSKHHVLEAAHPSPLAGNAFSECAHFSKANEILRMKGFAEIDWQL